MKQIITFLFFIFSVCIFTTSCDDPITDNLEYTNTSIPENLICDYCDYCGVDGRHNYIKNHYMGKDKQVHCFIYYGTPTKYISKRDTIKPYMPMDPEWQYKI